MNDQSQFYNDGVSFYENEKVKYLYYEIDYL